MPGLHWSCVSAGCAVQPHCVQGPRVRKVPVSSRRKLPKILTLDTDLLGRLDDVSVEETAFPHAQWGCESRVVMWSPWQCLLS